MAVKKTTKSAKTEVEEYDWSQEETTGFESTNQSDLGIPFLQIIQSGSPEFDKKHDDYPSKKIEGIQEGDIINSLTREILYVTEEDPLLFVPCYAEKLYPEFKPRGSNGGFVQVHRDASILNRCKRNEKNKDVLQDGAGKGNEIITTHYIYGFAQNSEGSWDKAVIGMTSTQLKNARRFLNMMQSIKCNGKTPPMFSHIYELSTKVEKNNEGSWMGWNFATHRMLNPNVAEDRELVMEARETAKSFKEQILALESKTTPALEDGGDDDDERGPF